MKKIAINEERLREIIKEAMGIAIEVNDISQKIELKILNLIENGVTSKDFKEGDLNIHFDNHDFSSYEDMVKWAEENYASIKSGYSYSENKLYLTFFSVNGKIDTDYIYETIQHEVEHYWQDKNIGKPLSCYNNKRVTNVPIEDLMASQNMYVSYFARIIYLTKKFEIDAYVNGAYSVLRKNKFRTSNDFIKGTELKSLINLYQQYYNWLLDVSFKSPTVIMSLTICKNAGLIKKIHRKEHFLKLIEDALDYLMLKIGRAWALYTAYPVDKEKIKENITSPLFRKAIMESNLHEYENNNAGDRHGKREI